MGESEEEGGRRFLLLYGSQTGQAKAIAEIICEKALERGLLPDIHCFSQSEKEFDLTKEPVVVVVVSTTGDGEAPDTVSKFWRKLKKKTVPETHLAQLHYGLLGLGDTNYTNFCNMGKRLHKRLQELGATPFTEPGWADDGVGLELVVEPWIEDLWEPLETTLKQLMHSLPDQTEGVKSPEVSMATSTEADTTLSSVSKITEPAPSVNPEFTDSVPPVCKNNEPELSVNSEFTDSVPPVCKTSEPELSVNSEFTDPVPPVPGVASQPPTSNTASAPEVAVGDTLSDLLRELKGVKVGDETLSLPNVPPLTLSVKIEKQQSDGAEFRYHDVEYVYSQAGGVVMATVVGCRRLTGEGALRETIEFELCVQGREFSYVPGDAVSFVCPNPAEEVNLIMDRLGLMSCADHMMQLEINNSHPSTGKTPVLPRHIPPMCSVCQYFTHCADFRAIPKKVMLAYLSSCCGNEEDQRRLAELSSREYSSQYRDVCLVKHVDLLDVLFAFPSCQPSLDRLVQFLPRLKPRMYSIASSPLTSPGHLRIALSVLSLPLRSWWTDNENSPNEGRKGLASGYLYSLTKIFSSGTEKFFQVPLAPRGVNSFHLPNDPSIPVIMIGPGTGVAPFLGFLEHRRNQRRNGTGLGRAWLFFGCRHPDQDYIYREELAEFVSDGTLDRLTVCFSRLEEARSREGGGRYVQDGMRTHATELAHWVVEHKACIYVCGEARGMARDVEVTWTAILTGYQETQKGVERGGSEGREGDEGEGEKIVRKLKESSRYLVDAWNP